MARSKAVGQVKAPSAPQVRAPSASQGTAPLAPPERSSGERSEPERSGGGANGAGAAGVVRDDVEVPEKPKRRRFDAEYKVSILQQADNCAPGELGALLRRQGLYSSHLNTWRRQRLEGALAGLQPKPRGPKPNVLSAEAQRVVQLERENEKLLSAAAFRRFPIVTLFRASSVAMGARRSHWTGGSGLRKAE